jgi:hypothetical protein
VGVNAYLPEVSDGRDLEWVHAAVAFACRCAAASSGAMAAMPHNHRPVMGSAACAAPDEELRCGACLHFGN